jgi:SAM-dependent methyltransferase
LANKDLSLSAKVIVTQTLWRAAQVPVLRPALIAYYEYKASTSNWDREHPYDRAPGLRTSGMLSGFLLRPGEPMDVPTTIYSAAQPSILRQALATIPDPQHRHFLDLRCGKGRPLLVATEFRFAAIIGVELFPTPSRIARRNADVFSRVYPDRAPIVVVLGDALAYELPTEKLVIFLYNPFHRPRRIESSLETISVWADVFDASAASLPNSPTSKAKIGYGPDESDLVVVWQNRGNPHPCPPGARTAPVSIISPGWRAEMAQHQCFSSQPIRLGDA